MKYIKKFESLITDDILETIKELVQPFEDSNCHVYIGSHDDSAAKQLMKPGDPVYSIRISKEFQKKDSKGYNQNIEEIINFKEDELSLISRLRDLDIDFVYNENGHSKSEYYSISREIMIGDLKRYDK